jgi:hypothetical protein
MRLQVLRSNSAPDWRHPNTKLQNSNSRGISSILDTVGVLANQLQKLRASFFFIVEYALDGETADAATEPQILQRNESRDNICRAAH